MFPLVHAISIACRLGSLTHLQVDLREEMVPEFFLQNNDTEKELIGHSLCALSSLNKLESLDIRISHDLQMIRYFDVDSHVVAGFAHGYSCLDNLKSLSSHVLPGEPRALLDMIAHLPNLREIYLLSFGAHGVWRQAQASDRHDKLERLVVQLLKTSERDLESLVSACRGLFSSLVQLEIHVDSVCCEVADMVRILSGLTEHATLETIKCAWEEGLEETSKEFATLFREQVDERRIELVEIDYSD